MARSPLQQKTTGDDDASGRSWQAFLQIGPVIIVCILIGFGVGLLIDVFWMFILMVAGLAVGVYLAWRIVKREIRRESHA